MFRVLKIQLTRRLFWLFFSLALVPTLIMTLVFSVYRINADQNKLMELEKEMAGKPTETFNMLVKSKAEHYRQFIDYRLHTNIYLSDVASRNFQISDMDEFDQLIQNVMALDPVMQGVVVLSMDQEQPVYISSEYEYQQSEINWMQLSLNQQIVNLRKNGNENLLSIQTAIFDQKELMGVMIVDYELDMLVNEVPKYYLAETAVMFLVSDDLEYFEVPDWADDAEYLLDYFETDVLVEDILLTDMEYSDQADELSGFIALNSEKANILEFSELTRKPCYVAISQVPGTQLNVVLLLPLEEVYSTAEKYGATLTSEAPAILAQFGLTMLALMISVGIGAIVTLRTLAEPIEKLSFGAKEVARGNLDYKVPEEGMGEILELGSSFNSMVDAVKHKNIQLEEMLKTQKKEFDLINQVSYQANLQVELRKKLSATLDVIISELDMKTGYIFLANEIGGLFRVEGTGENTDDQLDLNSMRLMINQFIETISKTERIFIYDHTAVGSDLSEFGYLGGFDQSLIGSPIRFHERMVGVMVLVPEKLQSNHAGIQNFISALSTHIAILIEVSLLQNQARFLEIADERRRLARDLHDSVTQTLFSLSLALEGLLSEYHNLPDSIMERLQFIGDQALNARSQMRVMINDLRPIVFTGTSFIDSIRSHVSSLERSSDAAVDLIIEGDVAEVPDPIKFNLDHIVQEALSNIARHSNSSEVWISLSVEPKNIVLTIEDNGIGFDELPEETSQSFGLMNIRERGEIMGGEVVISSRKEQGTKIIVLVPWQQDLYGDRNHV